jgi:UrcA family protein
MFAPTRTFMPLALLAAVAVTCLQGAAFAGAVPMEPTQRTVSVPVAGLNLASPEAQANLDATLKRAARQVCAPADYRDLRAVADRAACEKTALATAKARRDVLVARAQAEQMASRVSLVPATN